MCEVLDWVENRGKAEGLQLGIQEGRLEGRQEGRLEGKREGRLEGRQEAMLQSLRNIMERLSLSAAAAMEALGIPAAEQGMYLQMLENTR